MARRNYKLLNQEPYCCVPTILQTILRTKDINMKQTDIAQYLDLRLPESDKHLLTKYPFATIAENSYYEGCNVVDLNKQLFIPLNLPFEEVYTKGSNELSTCNIIINNFFKEGSHVATGVNFGKLMGNMENNSKHLVLVKDIELNKSKLELSRVYLVIPETNTNGGSYIHRTSLARLAKATVDGIWLILEKDN